MSTATATATFNGFTFSYETVTTEPYELNEYCDVYSNIVVIESDNPKFKKGDKLDQITVSIKLHFERADGTEY